MEFPPILVINLDTRQDRWAAIQTSFSSWTEAEAKASPLERVSAVKSAKGWMGCRDSHIKCINIAKERGYPWVLVLEDDCLPKPTSFTQFSELLPTLWESRASWNVFLGGGTSMENHVLLQTKPPLFQVKAYTTHFCLYPAESYDLLISVAMARHFPIDFNYRKSPDIKQICTHPFLAIQAPGRSDIESGKIHDYTSIFLYAENFLGRMLNSPKLLSSSILL